MDIVGKDILKDDEKKYLKKQSFSKSLTLIKIEMIFNFIGIFILFALASSYFIFSLFPKRIFIISLSIFGLIYLSISLHLTHKINKEKLERR